jgi:uncharacterized protein (TIGR02646 family)
VALLRRAKSISASSWKRRLQTWAVRKEMIYVDRSTVSVPEQLTSARANKERDRILRLLTGSREHLNQTRIKFDASVVKAAKPALVELFHGKCAYCESPLGSMAFADVVHFRPKAGVEESDGSRSHYYYSWLAYEWENLLISCALCDSSLGKRNSFPVLGSRAQLLASVAECRATENSLLLDPCFDQPEEHLSFDSSGSCAARSERGAVTIRLLHLNRVPLVEARHAAWTRILLDVDVLAKLLLQPPSEATRAVSAAIKGFFSETLSTHRPYTAVARAALRPRVHEFEERGLALGIDIAALLREKLREVPPQAAYEGPGADVVEVVTALSEPRRQYTGRAKLPPHAYGTIRRIEVRNFKALEAVDFKLPEQLPGEEEKAPVLMFLGENATGKSSVLEAIALALLGTEEIAKLGLKAGTFVRRADQRGSPLETTDPAEVVIHFDEGSPVRLTIDPRSGRFEGNMLPATVLLGYGPRRFFSDRRRVHRSHHQSERVLTLFNPLAVISNPTSWLMTSDRQRFNAVIRALRELLLLPDEALITRPPRGQRRAAEIMFEVQGEPEPLRRLSEGYKTTIATGVDVMREMLEYWPDLETARGVVLIDELDAHLHPRWKMRIVGRLRRAMPGVQFIATTHDPLCLRGLADGEAHVLRRDAQHRIEQVTDLPNVRGLSVEQLLTSEFFGLYSTEDPEFEEDVAHYAALAAKRDRSPAEESELEQYRGLVGNTVTLGSRPESRLVLEAVSEFMEQIRQAAANEKPALKQAAVDKVIDLWRSTSEDQEA